MPRRLPWDHSRCLGEDQRAVCPKRDRCARYVDLSRDHGSTVYTFNPAWEEECTGFVDADHDTLAASDS